jgi:hypothetical protein
MSFTGDLEHLPIVDVVQLLHSTRKSGILRVKCRKGESQLVFKDGYFVSANHLNNHIRIGKILVDLNVITPEILDLALTVQKNAVPNQKPLVITLIDMGLVNEKDAYRGLEHLIEMTLVEILTWKKGTFTLDVLPESVTDEYIYYQGKMNGEIKVDTQRILMDSLRIIDEKMRDGELPEEDLPEEDVSPEEAGNGEEGPLLSLDDLGLAELDKLEKKVPEIFTALEDRDAAKIQYREIEKIAPNLSIQDREALATFLADLSVSAKVDKLPSHQDGLAQSILYFSGDELFKHAVTTACKHAGVLVFTSNEEQDLDPIIEQSMVKNSLPLLVFDAPEKADERFSAEQIALLRRQKREKYPQIDIIQLVSPDDTGFALQSYIDGIMAVLPRPSGASGLNSFAADTIRFLQAFQSYTRRYAAEREFSLIRELRNCIRALRHLRTAPEVALALLQFTARIFERSVTLIVRETELVAEKGIGVKAGKSKGVTPAMGFRIPLAKPSLMRKVIEEGSIYYGKTDDAVVKEHLFSVIGVPGNSSILLLPLKLRGKTISLTYGDFGDKEPAQVNLDLLEILASQSELVLDNSIQHKKLVISSVKG